MTRFLCDNAASPTRRLALKGMVSLVGLTTLGASAAFAQTRPLMEVWKDPNCGCCKDWVKLMSDAGFNIKT